MKCQDCINFYLTNPVQLTGTCGASLERNSYDKACRFAKFEDNETEESSD